MLVGTVATDAVIRQNAPDIAVKINHLRGPDRAGAPACRRNQKDQFATTV
jgi:hypothetical protein